MPLRKVLAVVGLCAALCLCLGLFVDISHAQNDNKAAKSVDKQLASKKGVGKSLASTPDSKKTPGATPVQMAIGIGSIFVMIAVMKWL